jgi:hypothetical protein
MTADTAAHRAERRQHRRNQTSLLATVNYGCVLLPCFVADVSRGGARIKLIEPGKLPTGAAVLECTRFGNVEAELVWQRGLFAGFKFAASATLGEIERHLATSAPVPAPDRASIDALAPPRDMPAMAAV